MALLNETRFVVSLPLNELWFVDDGGRVGCAVLFPNRWRSLSVSGSRVAFNGTEDRFVLTGPRRTSPSQADSFLDQLIVIRRDGLVFGHDVTNLVGERHISEAYAFTGSKVAFNGDVDRFVTRLWDTILVVRADGAVFGHTINGRTMSEPFAFAGSRVAFNGADDRFVLTRYGHIVVVRRDGAVFGHDVDPFARTISEPFAFSGSRVAFNGDVDRFVVSEEDYLIVVRSDGELFRHDVVPDDRTIAPPTHLPWEDAI